jgi:lysophospholipase L1-like esterase
MTAAVVPLPSLALLSAATFVVFSFAVRSGVFDLVRLRSVGRGLLGVYKKTAMLAFSVVLWFACLELASSGILKAGSALGNPEENVDPRAASSYYASQDWAPLYWREFRASRRQKYRPYVLWRRAAFSGATINIDENGVRSTPGANCGPNAFKVFVFGSSTVWGTGSPDWGTLPAHLQTELQRVSAGPVCVVNFGESAYVSTQSVLQLLVLVQSGNVPNLVISYEGLNDVFSAYQSGKSGVHENLDQLAATFEQRESIGGSAIGRFMRNTNLFSVTVELLQRMTHSAEDKPKLLTYETMGIDQNELAASVAQKYLRNYDVVDALARKYGFEFRFFWPPYVSIGRKPLTAEEQAIARRVDPALDMLYHSVYRMIEAEAGRHPKSSDISGVFDNYSGLVWLDELHVTPPGNRVLAKKLRKYS